MRAFAVGLGLFSAVTLGLAAPPPADAVLAAARAQAAAEHKAILLHFGASWCIWCRRFDGLLAAPEIRPLLARHFVFARLDVLEHGENQKLENPGAASALDRFGGRDQGLPYFVFLDAQGATIATSKWSTAANPEGKNIGYPETQEEIAQFLALLRQAAPAISLDDLKTIEHRLVLPYIMDGPRSTPRR